MTSGNAELDAGALPTAVPGRYDAFLSYARADRSFAVERLRAELERQGKRIWLDVEDIPGGTKWRARVRRGIEACKAFLFVISPASVASEHCRQELEEAVALNKLIIPVVYRDVENGLVPEAAAENEWIFLRDEDDFEFGINKLAEALDTDFEWRDQHTRLAGRTREWLDSGRHSSYLLRGVDLRAAEVWLTQQEGHREAPTPAQAEYVTRSNQAASRRQQTLLAAVLGGLAVTIGLAVFALIQRQGAIDETHTAQSELLANAAVFNADPQAASLLAIGAYRLSDAFEARSVILGIALSPELGTPLVGHTDQVKSVAVSPDGRTLASASSDRTVRLWDVRTHRQLGAPLVGHTDGVNGVAFSADGRTLASASDDQTIRLWDVATRRQLGPPLAYSHPGRVGLPVTSVAFSPDGRTLASSGGDSTVRLWDVASHRELGLPLAGHTDIVNIVAFSPDGRTLASGSNDRTVRLWDTGTLLPLGVEFNAGSQVLSVAFSPDGKTLATGTTDGRARLWDLMRHREPGRLVNSQSGSMTSVAFSHDGRTLASGSLDRSIQLWNVAARRPLGAVFTGHTSGVNSVAFEPDDRTLVSASADQTIRLWNTDVTSRRQLGAPFAGHTDSVTSVAFSPNHTTLASGSTDRTVRLWDVRTHRELGAPLLGLGSVNSVTFSPDGATLAVGAGNTVELWNAAMHRQLAALPMSPTESVASVAYSPSGSVLASGSNGDAVRLWNMATRRELGAPLTAKIEGVTSLAFSPNGSMLAVGGGDDTIRLWDVQTHRQVATLGQHKTLQITTALTQDTVTSVAFSPDGQTLAAGGDGHVIRLWDMRSHRQTGSLTGHDDVVGTLAFSPDGASLVSGSDDNTVRLWDLATRRQFGPSLIGHTGAVNSVAFSPDGRMLASGANANDNTVRLWSDYPIPAYVRQLCSYVDRRTAPRLWRQLEPSIPYQRPC